MHYDERLDGKVIIRGTSADNNTINYKEGDKIFAPVVNLNLNISIDAKTMEAKNLSQVLGEAVKNILGQATNETIIKLQTQVKDVNHV